MKRIDYILLCFLISVVFFACGAGAGIKLAELKYLPIIKEQKEKIRPAVY